MTGRTQTLTRARQLAEEPYDRDLILAHLRDEIPRYRIYHPDGNRMQHAAEVTLSVIDGLDGDRLADRWAVFETDIWPRWQAGRDRPPLPHRWSWGVWALVISRLVRPRWATIRRVYIGRWVSRLPADDPLRQARDQLSVAMTTALVGSEVAHENAVNTGVRLMLVCGVDRLSELTEDDMLKLPPGTKGADVLDAVLCQLGVFNRTPLGGLARRMTAPRHTPRELAVVHGVPELFVDVVAT